MADNLENPVSVQESLTFGERIVPGVSRGAMPIKLHPAQTIFKDIKGNLSRDDTRVRLLIPPKYITDHLAYSAGTGGKFAIKSNGGILFPYTPSVSYDISAEYSEAKPLHSNFSINFYQRSSVGRISISGKFSVESSEDAELYLATVQLLTSLTRMRSGGLGGDIDSGAPPPVCRLYANGQAMLHNVPVAVASLRVELPDSVDYFTIVKDLRYGTTSVPTVSTIAITCIPMYSRNEMQKFNVTGYTDGSLKNKGYI
jgi:hypothetical protein